MEDHFAKMSMINGEVLRILPADTNTDEIISGKYKYDEGDIGRLAVHTFESIDPNFYADAKSTHNPVLVAAKNFGCGSSREQAPLVLKHCGIACAIAETFARIFYRNAINIGLRLVECKGIAKKVEEKDELKINFDTGIIFNEKKGEKYEFKPLPEFVRVISDAGGLIQYLREKGGYKL
jgi:3-isopropylmalate/(R)-2-methylmalate dehydratase small subunit